MTEIRCPMCGKPNPENLDVCQFCQARLKPLISPASSDGGLFPEDLESDDELPDWLELDEDLGTGDTGEDPFDSEDDDCWEANNKIISEILDSDVVIKEIRLRDKNYDPAVITLQPTEVQ